MVFLKTNYFTFILQLSQWNCKQQISPMSYVDFIGESNLAVQLVTLSYILDQYSLV